MQEFIKPLAGSAVSPEETGVLSYGTEYLICGKDSDVSNLKGTVIRPNSLNRWRLRARLAALWRILQWLPQYIRGFWLHGHMWKVSAT